MRPPRILTSTALTLALCALPHAQDWPLHFESLPLGIAFNQPVGFSFAEDGSLLVWEKAGPVKVVRNGQLQAAPLIDLTDEVNNDWDRGMLGCALHPGFVPDGGAHSWIYLLYTVSPVFGQDMGYNTNQQYSFSRLTRYRVLESAGAWLADPASRQILLGHQLPDGSVPDCIASVHNSHSNGTLMFATDGSLLLTTGDGAHYDLQDNGGKDNAGFDAFVHPSTGLKGPTPKVQDSGAFRSQDPRSLSGKVLRIDPETGLGYASNPFYDGDPASNPSRVWALGLRNPFRAAFVPGSGQGDPSLGDPGWVLIGDVGWNSWEEVNLARGGENFGWPCFEGAPAQSGYQSFNPANPAFPNCHTTSYGSATAPLCAWSHGSAAALYPPGLHFDESGAPANGFSGNCSIGGALYLGGSYPPAFQSRYFFADFGQQWIRTMSFDANWQPTGFHDFGLAVGPIVDMEREPLTGDIWYLTTNGFTPGLYRIRYGANLTPVAKLSAAPISGPVPLLVQFDASGSFDPEADLLSSSWDFGDGSPLSGASAPQHSYTQPGTYTVALTISDPLGLSATVTREIYAGNTLPAVELATPLQGQSFTAPTALALTGAVSDAEDGALTPAWVVDLVHDTHVHPSVFSSDQPSASFPIDLHGDGDDLYYFKVALGATDSGGFTAERHAYVYPSDSVLDRTGQAFAPIARVDELYPLGSQSTLNKDIEVLRDGLEPSQPPVANNQQWTSFHGGDQGQDDWIGFESATPGATHLFAGLHFREGQHASDGGWWQSMWIEVRHNGLWTEAQNLRVDPPYPFQFAQQPGFDGLPFDAYDLWIDPLEGDAIRLRGNPGGSAHYISAVELRVRELAAPGGPAHERDITAQASAIDTKLATLTPPTSNGVNKDPETIRNGTEPEQGSTSKWAQFDTSHQPVSPGNDWIGYTFDELHLFSSLRFQEGLNFNYGGAFTNARVQVLGSDGLWKFAGQGATTPSFPGSNALSYESFEFALAPILGKGLRLYGDPQGSSNFVSCAELRVREPQLPASCAPVVYGAQPGGLELGADTPIAIGMPFALSSQGAVGGGPGVLAAGAAETSLALPFGTLLVDPSLLVLHALNYDAQGRASICAQLGNDPGLSGQSLYFQAAWLGPAPTSTTVLSNGLRVPLCIW